MGGGGDFQCAAANNKPAGTYYIFDTTNAV